MGQRELKAECGNLRQREFKVVFGMWKIYGKINEHPPAMHNAMFSLFDFLPARNALQPV
jgi:hypothetical protein